MNLHRLGRAVSFVAGSIVGGLALAFVIVFLRPQLLQPPLAGTAPGPAIAAGSAGTRQDSAAADDSEYVFYLTVAELEQLNADLSAMLVPLFRERLSDPAQRPAGSVPVELLLFSYPMAHPAAGGPETLTAAAPNSEDDGEAATS